jgi:hypothetical protein
LFIEGKKGKQALSINSTMKNITNHSIQEQSYELYGHPSIVLLILIMQGGEHKRKKYKNSIIRYI